MKDPLNIERKLDNLESLKEDDDKIKVLSRDSFLSKLSTRKLKCCHLIKRIDNRVINYTPVSRIQIKNINEVKCFLKDQTEVVCLRLTSNPTGLLGRYTRVSIVSKYGYLVVSNGNLINDRDDTITELWINLCEDSIENILNKWTGSSIKLHSYNDQIEEEDNAKLESLTHNLITRSHGMISKEDLIIKGSFDGYSMYIPTKTSILEISITEQPDLDIECSMHIKTDLFD